MNERSAEKLGYDLSDGLIAKKGFVDADELYNAVFDSIDQDAVMPNDDDLDDMIRDHRANETQMELRYDQWVRNWGKKVIVVADWSDLLYEDPAIRERAERRGIPYRMRVGKRDDQIPANADRVEDIHGKKSKRKRIRDEVSKAAAKVRKIRQAGAVVAIVEKFSPKPDLPEQLHIRIDSGDNIVSANNRIVNDGLVADVLEATPAEVDVYLSRQDMSQVVTVPDSYHFLDKSGLAKWTREEMDEDRKYRNFGR